MRNEDNLNSTKPTSAAAKVQMPFGTYRGHPVASLDDDYLLWLQRIKIHDPLLVQAIEEEIEARGLGPKLCEEDRESEEDYPIIDDDENCYMLRVRLGELETDADRLGELAEPEVCQLLGEVARLEARLKLRLMELTPRTNASTPDPMLTIDEAAASLAWTRDYLYRNSKRFPFTRREGRRLRFSQQGIEKYKREQMGSQRR